ncbi:hypothetical protein QNN03_05025 [Streptomyces sp. GXMU-J15]|uniref:Uncharacterized protein n=1 Tax=Streptomyces fuscus TaxID=3048495 RepID=A0ABT7IT76_9ACTN|nr:MULTISPECIES: hypothetical protein [Streptomyces]MDL2075796.1 hypothetical protein [Streptomyces fuscus]SBT93331.1 hypothetical protein GA0115233_10629 [Streptomyces sp. DI166]
MFRRNRADREFREAQRAGQALLAMHAEWPEAPAPVAAPTSAASTNSRVVPDFLPPEFRAPCRQDVSGFMMRWDLPLVIDGEIHACRCGAYRNWIVFNMRDDSVWLRCEAGHETLETRLDTAWYNRNSGPVDHFHPTLEDGLRHLGH